MQPIRTAAPRIAAATAAKELMRATLSTTALSPTSRFPTRRFLSLAGCFLAIACDSGGESTHSALDDKTTETTSADSVKDSSKKGEEWKPFALASLGVTVNAPANAKKAALGGISSSFKGWYCNVDIREIKSGTETYEQLAKQIEKGNIGGPIKEMKKNEKVDDKTFVIDFVGEKKSGFYQRQAVGAKTIQCGGNSERSSGYECVKKVCESLKAG